MVPKEKNSTKKKIIEEIVLINHRDQLGIKQPSEVHMRHNVLTAEYIVLILPADIMRNSLALSHFGDGLCRARME